MKRNIILAPGPTQVPQEVCEILGKPIIHHRTPQFQIILKEAMEGLKDIFQTKDPVYILSSSGTGAMEAAVCNLLSKGNKAITVQGGKFGERWSELCKAYNIETRIIDVEWGKDVDPVQIKDILDAEKNIAAVFVSLCETSTGVTSDIKAIADIVKKTDAVLVVDAISGLGVVDLQKDAWGVDVVVAGSQKGLMLPPGLAFISLSKKAFELVEKSDLSKYYLDLKKAKKSGDKFDTPFTPALTIVRALNESIRLIKEAGLKNQFAYYAKLSEGVKAAVKALGLELFASASCASNAVTAVRVPEGIDGGKLVKTMRDTHGITIAGGQGPVKGKIFRMAHMGCVDEYDILTGISCLEKVLKELGYKFELGDGLKAAQKVFNT